MGFISEAHQLIKTMKELTVTKIIKNQLNV